MQGDDVGDDGESETGSAVVAAAGVVETGEAFEDAGAVLCGHPWPVVVDVQDGPGPVVSAVNRYATASMLVRVVYEVADCMFQQDRRARHLDRLHRRQVEVDIGVMSVCGGDLYGEVVEVDGLLECGGGAASAPASTSS